LASAKTFRPIDLRRKVEAKLCAKKQGPPASHTGKQREGGRGGAKFRPADTAEQGSKNALFGPVDKAVGG